MSTRLRSTREVIEAELEPLPEPPAHIPECMEAFYCDINCGVSYDCQRPAGHTGKHRHVIAWADER